MFCKECEALGESCCQAAKERRAMAVTLAGLCDCQRVMIEGLTETVQGLRKTLRDVMDLHRIDK